MSDIEKATTQELIAELLSRSTFRGIILWQRESFKGEPLDGWRWGARNCDAREILRGVTPQIPEDA